MARGMRPRCKKVRKNLKTFWKLCSEKGPCFAIPGPGASRFMALREGAAGLVCPTGRCLRCGRWKRCLGPQTSLAAIRKTSQGFVLVFPVSPWRVVAAFVCVRVKKKKNNNKQEKGALLCVGAGAGGDLGAAGGRGGDHGAKFLLLAGELCHIVKITQNTSVLRTFHSCVGTTGRQSSKKKMCLIKICRVKRSILFGKGF